MTTYRKTMAEALKDVYLGENNLEKMRKASKGAAQTLKMKDGNLKMDSFTASAIMKIYDMINDKNKKTFEKMMKDGKKADIMKLQKFAMSKISSEYVPEEFEEEFELDEVKASGGYDLYHNDFSSAMQHAYKMAKKLYGITIDPKEIDDKVATGPKKPGKYRQNEYRLKGDKGAIQVQVYNKGGSKPFELNMYKEEVELDEGYEGEVVKVLKKAKIASYFSNGILYVERGDGKDAMAALKKAPNIKELPKIREEKPRREEVELDEAQEQIKQLEKMLKDLERKKKKTPGDGYAKMKIKELLANLKSKKEEVELDEAVKVGDTVKVKLNRKGREYIEKGKVIKIEKDSIIVKHDFSRTPSRVSMKNIVKEEVELDEGPMDGFLRLTFNNPADVKKAMKVSDTEFGYRHFTMDKARTRPELDIEGDRKDLQRLKDALKSAGIKFKIDLEEEVELDESKKALQNKADKSGVSYSILKKVYDRGMAAYKTGHRPGTTPQQWALARVNSFLTGGGARKADNDLWQQAKKQKEDLDEGTFALPDTPKKKAALKNILSKPLPVGKEGDSASSVMGSIIGDDELMDAFYSIFKKSGPRADGRPAIKAAMKRLGIKEEVELDEILTQRPRAGGGRHGKNVEMNLKVHFIIMQDYIKQGASKDEASKAAFKDVKAMGNREKQDIIKKGKSSLIYMKRKEEVAESWSIKMPPAEGGKTVTNLDTVQVISFIKAKGGTDSARKAIEKGQSVSFQGKRGTMYKITKEEVELGEDGHTDVSSAVRQCKTVMEDANQILSKLMAMNPEDSLPTWWSNKLAIASNSMNKMRDYLLVPSEMKEELEEALDKDDEATIKRIVGKLKKASQAHAGQAKDLEKAMNEQPEHEITVGGYTTKFFYMCGSAQEVMKKNADVEGAEEITKLQDDFYKLEKDVMDAGSATDGQKILAKEIYNKIMKLAGEAGLADDIDDYMKMHLDSIEKGDPKPGFGRTDIKEAIDPADVDDDATELDIKAADKNIMMQMRKVISLRGNFKVEFGDKKKMKLPPKIAMAVQKKYNSIKRPADKQKFTIRISKSYKDMLDALNEGFASDAQRRAAFAQGYKAKGKKGKKEETKLNVIHRQLREK